MAESNAERLAHEQYLTHALNTAIGAGLESQPENTRKTYRKSQRDFKVSIYVYSYYY
jgi:hypothetical protein